jgi:hypothetical protein
MTNKTKQHIFGIAANIFFLPPIYFAFINEQTKNNWKIICLSILPLIIVLSILWFYLGPQIFKKTIWEEEGYKSFSDWIKKSQTFNAKYFRFTFKYLLPAFVLFFILAYTVLLII